jgi:hypothetical protein
MIYIPAVSTLEGSRIFFIPSVSRDKRNGAQMAAQATPVDYQIPPTVHASTEQRDRTVQCIGDDA